jgi:putative membrane protein
MLTDALLLYLHLSAMLGLAVFLTAKTSLTRVGAVDAAVLARLRRLDVWVWGSFAAVLASGLALVFWGVKGPQWLLHNPLLWAKVLLLALMAAMSWPSTRRLARWAHQGQRAAPWVPPPAAEIRQERRWLMAQSHVMVIIPLLATLMSHGFG